LKSYCKLIFAWLTIVLGTTVAKAQLLDSLELASAKVYTNLQQALAEPLKVYKLRLTHQKLDSIPAAIFQFKNLQELDLSKNRIKEVPEKLGELQYLQQLNLSRNKITLLPASIGNLVNLKKLIANQNEIIAIPVQIGKLTKLEMLDLWSNELSFFPDQLAEIKDNLKRMDLRAILITGAEQDRIQNLLPKTKINFSPDCKCGQ
jgi:Leucine-rich repeat (LRR) protein